MRATRRGFLRGLVAVAAATALPMSHHWTETAAAAPVRLASQPQAPGIQLQAGADWSELLAGVPVSRLFAPASGALLAATANELLRSDDAGTSWRAISLPDRKPGSYITVDPTNHDTLYVAANDGVQRSDDAGTTWTTIFPSTHPNHPFRQIVVSPADPRILFAAQYEYTELWLHRSMVGGSGADALRFYLAANKDFRSGGSLLQTSSDDGATWTTILEHSGGGTMQGAKDPSTTLTGLAYDPAAPQRVCLAQQEKTGSAQDGGTQVVSGSGDSGASWSPLGSRPLAKVNELAVGIDGRYLFAATEHGVLRIAVG